MGDNERKLSEVLCTTLDHLGFKKENISFRTKCCDTLSELMHTIPKKINGFPYTAIIAGSSGEGVALSDSDNDCMYVSEKAICLDHADVDEHINVLQVDTSDTPPGYTRLVATHNINVNSSWSLYLKMSMAAVSPDNNYSFICSSKMREFVLLSIVATKDLHENIKFDTTTNGPAITWARGTYGNLSMEYDFVYAMHYYGDKHLSRWAKRIRHYSWPTSEIIEEISEMEGFVVPIGDKESEYQSLEWRICYTTAEMKLVSTLEGTHQKLYVLLKLLAKYVLKPVCKAITSYFVKNVVFWLAETTSSRNASPDYLIHLLLKSLHFIRHCFENNHLPNYMIDQRNLLRCALGRQEKTAIVAVLSECLEDGSRVIQRLPTLCKYLNIMLKNPETMLSYGRWRDKVEKLNLALFIDNTEKTKEYCHLFLTNPRSFVSRHKSPTISEHAFLLILTVIPECMSAPWMRIEELENLFECRLKGIQLL